MSTAQDHAHLMAKKSLRVVPIGVGQKHPPIQEWQRAATSEPETIDAWFDAHPEWGLGWKMGVQDDGRWLFAIDVDVHKGGRDSFKALIGEYGLADEFQATVTAKTGGGGFHFVFELPDGSEFTPTNRSKLRDGIDVRAEGGQIVVAPSLHPSTHQAYAWAANKAPWELPPQVASAGLMSMMAALAAPRLVVVDEVAASVARHPSQQAGDTPADWVRAHLDFTSYLVKHGWVHLGGMRWRRPGKTDRGSSAELKSPEGPLNVFTTEIPVELERLGTLDPSGQCVSVSLFHFIAAYEFGGDMGACSRWVRATYLSSNGGRPPVARRVAAVAPDFDVTPGVESPLNLSAAFWKQRPQLEHVLLAAQAAGCSPDALLVHALARTATFIHPCYKLPGVEQGLIGKPQTFDFLGCVVAETSGGKTMAAGVGEMLIPQPDPPADGKDPPIDFEQKVGSGEGIAEFFLVPEIGVNDEGEEVKTGRRVVGKQALFMSVDEGTGFTNQAGRKGATIVSTLASAWSGESLGQLNAAEETRRLVRGGRVRICAVINMQDSNGYKLYAPDLESVGFTGRLLFASAHDPSAPEPGQEPSWPGVLSWPIAAGQVSNIFYTYAEEIVGEIRRTRHGVLTKQLQIDRRQSQYLLLRCKVAAILATWEGRRHVTVDDWQIATEIIGMSSTCLEHLDYVHNVQNEVTAVTAAEFKLNVAQKAQTLHVRTLAVGWRASIVKRLKQGPKPWKGLKDICEAGPNRDQLKQIVEDMVDEGLLIKVGQRYQLA